MSLSEKAQDRLSIMDGCEIQSLKHECCVGINRNKVYGGGELLETLDTNSKVNYLWRAFVKQEGL